jgi:hypothetical protein
VHSGIPRGTQSHAERNHVAGLRPWRGALLILAPFFLLLPAGVMLGGVSFGTLVLVLTLSISADSMRQVDGFFIVAPLVISAALALVGVIRRGIVLLRRRELPSFGREIVEAFKRLLTLRLAFQIGIGAAFAAAAILYTEGKAAMTNAAMTNPQMLIVTLFAVFVGIVSATFTSYFMRSLIPWREEHPLFSNAVAYTLSALLGLIAACYAYIGQETFGNASSIGAILYQASVALGTLGATIVGGFIALQKKSNGSSQPPAPSRDG